MDKLVENIPLNDLRTKLQEEIKKVTLDDLYELSFHFNEENKYLPGKYKKQHVENVQNILIQRFKELKNDNKEYDGMLDYEDTENINEIFKKSRDTLTHILYTIVVYTTYLLKEPLHMPNMEFPGPVNIYTDGVNYYCPIKKYHMESKDALCKYCIAKTTME